MKCVDAVRHHVTEIILEKAAVNDCSLIRRYFGEKNIGLINAVIGMKLQDEVMEVRNKAVQMYEMMRLESLFPIIGRRKVRQLGYDETNNWELNLKCNKSLGVL
jgi:hypothetical protein